MEVGQTGRYERRVLKKQKNCAKWTARENEAKDGGQASKSCETREKAF